jgi:hypothetical protein
LQGNTLDALVECAIFAEAINWHQVTPMLQGKPAVAVIVVDSVLVKLACRRDRPAATLLPCSTTTLCHVPNETHASLQNHNLGSGI